MGSVRTRLGHHYYYHVQIELHKYLQIAGIT